MQSFYKSPASRSKKELSCPKSYYFSKYEEEYEKDSIIISGKFRAEHKNLSDRYLWIICFGGLILDKFEVTRYGLRFEIFAKMRDLKEIRKDIEEDRKKGGLGYE